jgi:hypothetical protein
MGMFDWVNVPPMKCPHCGKGDLDGWQSKDGPCSLDKVEYWTVDNFYTSCGECRKWVEFVRRSPRAPIPLTDYELLRTAE